MEGCFVRYPNTQKQGEKTRCRVFFNNFEVFGNLMKQSLDCLIQRLKAPILLGEIQRKSSLNLMIIIILALESTVLPE